MNLQQLFKPVNQDSVNYKPVDETTVSLTEKEREAVIRAATHKKIATINSENYLKAINYKPEYQVPTFDDLLEALIETLQKEFSWDIDKFNLPVIEMLAAYFSQSPKFLKMGENFSLEKGLLIFGGIGCGKTTLMGVLNRNPFNPYRIVRAIDMAAQYQEHGQSAINYYSQIQPVTPADWFGHYDIGMCIDDIGTENSKKNFGNEVNVISEVIRNRYDKNIGRNKTHTTTNLSGEELIQMYGPRATSRLRELVNFIEFPEGSPDRRK